MLTRSHQGMRWVGLMVALLTVDCNRSSSSSQAKPAAESESEAKPPVASSPLIIPVNTALTSFDPLEASDRNSRLVVSQLFDTVVDYGHGLDSFVPELAAELPRYDAERGELVIRVTTGADAIHFADDPCFAGGKGRVVQASDVRASLLRHEDVTRPTHALLAARLRPHADGWSGSITANDSTGEVRLALRDRHPELLAILASPQLAVVPPECVTYYDGQTQPAFREHPVGSGPYVLDADASVVGRRAVLDRRANLESPRTGTSRPPAPVPVPATSKLQVEYFRSPETALRLFQHREVAVLSPGQSQFAELFEGDHPKDPTTTVVRTPLLSTTVLMFNMHADHVGQSVSATADMQHRALRRAIALAFDAERYHSIVRNGAWAEPATHLTPAALLPPDTPAHTFAPGKADVGAAHRELERAGLQRRTWSLRYLTTDDENARQEADILRQALAPLGVQLDVVHDAQYLAKIVTRDPSLGEVHLFSVTLDADYPAVEYFLQSMTCTGDLAQLSGYCDAAYDTLFQSLGHSPTEAARRDIIAELEAHLGEEVPLRPIDHPQAWLIAHADIRGIERHPMAGLRLERIYRER